jgi:hypothetical protein
MEKSKEENPINGKFKKFLKIFLIILCIPILLFFALTIWSMIGRLDPGVLIPDSAVVRIHIPHPVRFLDGIMSHEAMHDISVVPALAPAVPVLHMLNENSLHKNRWLRFALRGKLEFSQLPSIDPEDDSEESKKSIFAVSYDLGFFSSLFRLLPSISRFKLISNLYYVQAGDNSRFEYRTNDITLYIGQYHNLLFITNDSTVYESRSANNSNIKDFLKNIKPSLYDAIFLIAHDYIYDLFAEQDPKISAVLDNLYFKSMVEAGLSIGSRKLEFHLAAPLSSEQPVLGSFLESRSSAPIVAERFPASSQYTTVLSAGTLKELYQAALLFTPDLDETLRTADSSSRLLLGLTLDELLFSWSGKEFSVFGLEGRPHPVFAIQIADERVRQEVFDKAFRSIFISEDVRLNLDGVRMPRIAVPEFLQALLRKWDIFLPSPYYTIYKDFLLISESADTLLSALRAMQKNDVLTRTAAWRSIAGGRTVTSALSLYYSLDLSIPFFLRKNTNLSAFLTLYRQGLVRMSFDRGLVELSVSLVPGSGNGVTLLSGYPLDIGYVPSNQVFGSGRSRVFFSSFCGTASNVAASNVAAFSVDLIDNTIYKLEGQGYNWIIPANIKDNAWVVSDRGRVTLVDGNMEPVQGFPVLTGLLISSPPQVFEGLLYLCDEDGKVHTVNEHGAIGEWETSFMAAVRSPPSFLTIPARGRNRGGSYSAVYPKSFFGEIWLLDTDGRVLPNWPAPVSLDAGIGFGSPLLFAHNNNVYIAFVCQSGELIVYDENASVIRSFPLYLNRVFYHQPVFDGEYLWLISSDGTLFRVSLEGEFLYQNIPGLSVMEEGYITVFDSSSGAASSGTASSGNNKVPDVFFAGEGNALYAFTRNFRSLEGFPLPVWGRPYFIEAQGSNRKAEIIGMGMDQRLYRWQFR